MRKKILLGLVSLVLMMIFVMQSHLVFSQGKSACDIRVNIIKDRFMQGKAFVVDKKPKRISVRFTANVVQVLLPKGEKGVLLAIDNNNCRAYCPRAKKVRVLKKGDEKLLINLLKNQRSSLADQLSQCGI